MPGGQLYWLFQRSGRYNNQSKVTYGSLVSMATQTAIPSASTRNSSNLPLSANHNGRMKRPWQPRMHSLPVHSRIQRGSEETLSREVSHVTANTSTPRQKSWWKVRLFRGMINDVKRRAPFYWSDWRDAWDYRVVPATVYMYFAKYAFTSEQTIQAFSSWLSSPMLQRYCFDLYLLFVRA